MTSRSSDGIRNQLPGISWDGQIEGHFADRPLWYRVAALAEPSRPLFGWAVAHKRGVKAGASVGMALCGLLFVLLAGRRIIS